MDADFARPTPPYAGGGNDRRLVLSAVGQSRAHEGKLEAFLYEYAQGG